MTDEVLFAIASTQQALAYLSINGCNKISRLPTQIKLDASF